MQKFVKKYRILILIELLLLLLSIPLCFAKEELVYTAVWENEFAADSGGEPLTLFPGVYQVRVECEALANGEMDLEVEAPESSFQALRCNGVTIREGQRYAKFEVYVLEKTDNVHVVRCFHETNASELKSVKIYKTAMGGRMLLFCILAGSVLINVILYYREKVLAGSISGQKQMAFWILLFSVALAYFPYATDYFSFGADSYFHLLRIEGLKETLMGGRQFPVRVQDYWLYDHGYAVSTFYGDFFLFLPALMRIIGFSLMTSYKVFVLLVMTATAAVSWYSLKRCTKSDSAALLGSVVYVLAPYRIYNVYNRGAVGEYLAMIFLPLVICGIYGLYTERVDDKRYIKNKIPLIIGLCGILQSHLLTCEMALFGIIVTCLILWRKTFRRQTFSQLLQAAVICLLVNCWFWLPLLQMMGMDDFWLRNVVEEDIQAMGTLPAGIVQIWPNMGGYQTGMYNCEPIQVGIAALFMLVVFWILYIGKVICRRTAQKNVYDKAACFFGLGSIILVILSTNFFPWDFLAKIPGLRFFVTALQFPTRMLSPASAFCAVFAAFFLLWIREEKAVGREVIRGMYWTVLLLAFFSGVYQVNSIAYEIRPVRLYNAENMGSIGVGNGEYLLEGSVLGEYKFHDPIAEEGLEWYDYLGRGTNISVSVNNHTDRELSLMLPIIGYKGYEVDCAEDAAELPYIAEEPERSNGHCDLKIMVPAGYNGELKVSYKGFVSYRVAELISVVSLLFIGGYFAKTRKRNN